MVLPGVWTNVLQAGVYGVVVPLRLQGSTSPFILNSQGDFCTIERLLKTNVGARERIQRTEGCQSVMSEAQVQPLYSQSPEHHKKAINMAQSNY